MSESVESVQDELIKKLEEHIETQNKIIELQDQIIANYDAMLTNIPQCKEKINHLKLVIDNVKNSPVKKEDEINFSTGSKFDENGFKFPDKVSVKDPLIIGDLTGDYSEYLAIIIISSIKEQLLITDGVIHADVSLEHLGCDSLDFLELFMVIENKLHESFHIEITDEMTEMFRRDIPIEKFISDFTKYFHKLNPKRKK